MKEFTVKANDAGQRLDKFVFKVTESLPHSLLYKAVRTKKIKVNRKRCEPGQLLSEGDTVQLFLAPEFFGEKEHAFLDLRVELQVVYEDEHILLAEKPEGLSCHSDATQTAGTLIDHVKAYLARKGEYDPREENSFAPALCNRIDRNTSGLVICAKTAVALREMNEIIRRRRLEKRYLALCHGKPDAEGTVTVYLKKDEEKNRVSVSDTPKKGYLTAVTEWKREEYDAASDRSLLTVTLHTGRTHQIRATMAHLGHPLVGDGKYGKDRHDPTFSHQALRAHSLRFFPEETSPLAYLAGKQFFASRDERFLLKK